MRMWGVILNFLAGLIIACMFLAFSINMRSIKEDFAYVRFNYAAQNAADAAFYSTLDVTDLEITYDDLGNPNIQPGTILPTFETMMCLQYDMALTEHNYRMMENYISGALLAVGDGFYVASMQQETEYNLDNTPNGYTYKMTWGFKRPYLSNIKGSASSKYFDVAIGLNLNDEGWRIGSTNANDSGTNPIFREDNTFNTSKYGVYASKVKSEMNTAKNKEARSIMISECMTEALQVAIARTNWIRSGGDIYREFNEDDADENNWGMQELVEEGKNIRVGDAAYNIYIPYATTQNGVNNIKKKSVLIIMQGVDFAGAERLDYAALSGIRIEPPTRIIGFEDEDGILRYCKAGQLIKEKDDRGEYKHKKYLKDMKDAVNKGYVPEYNLIGR